MSLSNFNVVIHPVECQTWEKLLEKPTKNARTSSACEDEKDLYLGDPITSVLQLDLSATNIKTGSFKIAAFGTSTTAIFNTNNQAVCAKCAYFTEEKVIQADGGLTKKEIHVPYKGKKQFQLLMMEVSCLVWAQALLDLAYSFVKEESGTMPMGRLHFHIQQFRFIKAGVALTVVTE